MARPSEKIEMSNGVVVIRCGRVPLAIVDRQMRLLQQSRIDNRVLDTLILVEHPEVVTAGRRAKRDGVEAPADKASVEVDRGGGLTWHGPGQAVVYPIFAWRRPSEKGVGVVIERLESWLIDALARLGVVGVRDQRMHGVWIPTANDAVKIASIGLSFNHWVTRHGCSINLETPNGGVESFQGCGLPVGQTTSIRRAVGRSISRDDFDDALLASLPGSLDRFVARVIDARDTPLDPDGDWSALADEPNDARELKRGL